MLFLFGCGKPSNQTQTQSNVVSGLIEIELFDDYAAYQANFNRTDSTAIAIFWNGQVDIVLNALRGKGLALTAEQLGHLVQSSQLSDPNVDAIWIQFDINNLKLARILWNERFDDENIKFSGTYVDMLVTIG